MITFNDTDKRWLEIVLYLFCRKVFSINQKQSDIIEFIKGFRWTNMFDYDKLIDTIINKKILLDSNFQPSKHEFLVVMNSNDCRLRYTDKMSIRELVRGTEYNYYKKDIFHAAMKEEINKTLIFPKLDDAKIHATIYSFLLAIRYVGDLTKRIKF